MIHETRKVYLPIKWMCPIALRMLHVTLHCSLTSNLVNFEFPDTLTTDSESSWYVDFENNLGFAVTSCAIKIYIPDFYTMNISQYLYKGRLNFYWNFLKSGITGHGQIMCFFEILRSRAFRISGQSVWEHKIHKIRRQGTVSEESSIHFWQWQQ